MRVVNIRRQGKILNTVELRNLATNLQIALIRSGFLTGCEVISSSGINIANGATTFRIDTQHLGYNAKLGFYSGQGVVIAPNIEQGYVRTNSPTWAQKVAFNAVVNRVLDEAGVTADVKSGNGFVVRTSLNGAVTNFEWEDDKAGVLVVSMHEAVRLVKEAKEKRTRQMSRRPSSVDDVLFHVLKPRDLWEMQSNSN